MNKITWRTAMRVWLAWASVGGLHALSQYSDIVKYDIKSDYTFANAGLLILSYSLWTPITLVLLRFIKSFSFPFLTRELGLLFSIGLVSWLAVFFSLDVLIGIVIRNKELVDWLPAFKNISGVTVFYYAVLFGLTFVACLGLVLAEKTIQAQQINTALRQKQTESALLLSEKKMQLMQLQLSPHFLFNCMGALSGLARMGKRTTLVTAIATIGNLLRFTIENSSSKIITLDEELAFVSDYIELQKLRFEERFTCEFDVSEFDSDVMCPPFTLQLLVENVFRHAVDHTEKQVEIKVSIVQNLSNIDIHVCNSHSEVLLNTQNTGIGIENLKSRLAHLYADKFAFDIAVKDDIFSVFLTIPKGPID